MDGNQVVIALPELDPAFTDKQIALVFLKDGKPLDDKEGSYRIVIPSEKRMARWVRQVKALKIVNMVGIERKKENSKAASREMPAS